MITFQELKSNFVSASDIPYFELIKTKEWYDRRESIIARDGHKCTTCGKLPTMAHYDFKSGKTVLLWFGEEKLVYAKNEDGHLVETYLPEVTFADKPYSLHVHHKLYVLDKLPWDYSDNELIVLCNWCHWDFHENNVVPVYKTANDKLEQIEATPCTRCNGAGWFPEYTHVQSGICFRCRGARYEQLIRH
ncbi:MAG: hypothetical protein IT235_07580 [Bacteroidia bacterium]|nr:hypothetical protein [Bacteroidia bacterium]